MGHPTGDAGRGEEERVEDRGNGEGAVWYRGGSLRSTTEDSVSSPHPAPTLPEHPGTTAAGKIGACQRK